MDVYLHRAGLERVFVRRMPVGLGRDDLTPVGRWRVGAKLVRDVYYPAPNSPNRGKPIAYGQPGYAFGAKGLWISLEGADENTAGQTGYGIHSTDKPESVGRDESEGCIRLKDDDIELLFSLLYERESTVEIRP